MATKLAASKVNAAAHLISDLLAESVDGATMKQITNDLLIGPVLAKAALESIEAVEINGRWGIASSDDAPAKPAPAPAKATSQPVEKQEMAIPVSESNQAATSTGIPVDRPLKQLDQSVFDGLPAEYKWAAIDCDGSAWAHIYKPEMFKKRINPMWSSYADSTRFICNNYDATDWQNSLIERLSDTCIDDMGIANFQKECERMADIKVKSDYAIAMDIERETVLTVIQSGATLARVAEITGLHIDDAQHHVDVLIDLGKVVARPVVVATAYEVVA